MPYTKITTTIKDLETNHRWRDRLNDVVAILNDHSVDLDIAKTAISGLDDSIAAATTGKYNKTGGPISGSVQVDDKVVLGCNPTAEGKIAISDSLGHERIYMEAETDNGFIVVGGDLNSRISESQVSSIGPGGFAGSDGASGKFRFVPLANGLSLEIWSMMENVWKVHTEWTHP